MSGIGLMRFGAIALIFVGVLALPVGGMGLVAIVAGLLLLAFSFPAASGERRMYRTVESGNVGSGCAQLFGLILAAVLIGAVIIAMVAAVGLGVQP